MKGKSPLQQHVNSVKNIDPDKTLIGRQVEEKIVFRDIVKVVRLHIL